MRFRRLAKALFQKGYEVTDVAAGDGEPAYVLDRRPGA